MADMQLKLTPEERNFLISFLTYHLKETRVEEHRTDARDYRTFVVQEENLIQGLLAKLKAQT